MAKEENWKQLRLVVLERGKRKAEYRLDKPTIGIGRSSINQIVLPDKGVSPFHARITVDGKECTITNLGAHEGLKVNGEKTHTRILSPGDEIQIGRAHLKVARDVSWKRALVRKEETPHKEATPRKKKVKLHIPVRLIVILIAILIVILIVDIHWLIQLINWQ